MNSLYKLCAWGLMVAVLNLQVPLAAIAAEAAPAAKTEGIQKKRPEIFASPELPIPPGTRIAGKKSNTWMWWALGGAVLVGALAAGGGGGGGGDTGGGSTGSTGSVTVGW